MGAMLDVGQKLPEFTLENQDGQSRTNAAYSGRWLVLYIYPEDDTAGCTVQGKAFTATKSDFDGAGAVVVGLSPDDTTSHKDFCNKFSFEIELLADPAAKLLSALGAGQTDYNGTMYWNRTTFLVDPAGVVRKVYTKVKPDGHEQAVLKDIAALKA